MLTSWVCLACRSPPRPCPQGQRQERVGAALTQGLPQPSVHSYLHARTPLWLGAWGQGGGQVVIPLVNGGSTGAPVPLDS